MYRFCVCKRTEDIARGHADADRHNDGTLLRRGASSDHSERPHSDEKLRTATHNESCPIAR
jgi:hypothetical protein